MGIEWGRHFLKHKCKTCRYNVAEDPCWEHWRAQSRKISYHPFFGGTFKKWCANFINVQATVFICVSHTSSIATNLHFDFDQLGWTNPHCSGYISTYFGQITGLDHSCMCNLSCFPWWHHDCCRGIPILSDWIPAYPCILLVRDVNARRHGWRAAAAEERKDPGERCVFFPVMVLGL